MSTTTPTSIEQSDREEVMRALIEKRKPDPEVVKRVQARADAIRATMPMLPAGTCVDLIRSGRDE